jgi:hypothetical protein
LHPIRTLLTASLVLVCGASTAAAQTVLFEDFETPDTGNFVTYFSGQHLVTNGADWAITANSVDLYEDPARPEAAAFDGSQAVDLTGSPDGGTMETTFATAPGTDYTLTFHYARNNLLGATIGNAQVDVLGAGTLLSSALQHDPSMHAFDTYLQFSDSFTANSVQTTLRFTGLNAGLAGITIDAISVTGAPGVPGLPGAALAVLAGGLVTLGIFHLRRRRFPASRRR